MVQSKIFFQIIIICSLSIVSCNEILPLREDISSLVTVSMRSAYFAKSHFPDAGKVQLFITIINKTDETLEDIAKVSGTIVVQWEIPLEEIPTFNTKRTMKINTKNIFYARKYVSNTNMLTLDPGDSLVVSTIWDLMTDDSTYLMNYFPALIDSTCFVTAPTGTVIKRKITGAQKFLVTANLKIFDRLAILYPQQISMKHCFMVEHSGEVIPAPPGTRCADFTIFDPCSVINQ